MDFDTGNTAACADGHQTQVKVSGFSIDPGQAWLTSVTCNGITKTGVSASSFSYSGGIAVWTWATGNFGFKSKAVGSNVACTVTHP